MKYLNQDCLGQACNVYGKLLVFSQLYKVSDSGIGAELFLCQSYLQGLCVPSLQQKSHLTGSLDTTHISFFTWDCTHFRTSSLLRLEPSDCLRPFSSLKLGEYLLSSFVLPVLVACITPATTNHKPSVPPLPLINQSINPMSLPTQYSLSRVKGYCYATSRLRTEALS